jgi:hypothetical protein
MAEDRLREGERSWQPCQFLQDMVTDTSDTGAALAWSPIGGASVYRVWRAGPDDAFDPVGNVAGPSYGDSGLTSQSLYRWRV